MKMAKESSSELKKLLTEKRLVLGTERTKKMLLQGKLAKVLFSANVPAAVKAEISKYAAIGKTDVAELSERNEELGILCKKPYAISVLGVLKSK
jgi:large subunit ribosomal protein L30e